MGNKNLDISKISLDLMECQDDLEKIDAILYDLIEEYKDEIETDSRSKRLFMRIRIIYDYIAASEGKIDKIQNLIV